MAFDQNLLSLNHTEQQWDKHQYPFKRMEPRSKFKFFNEIFSKLVLRKFKQTFKTR